MKAFLCEICKKQNNCPNRETADISEILLLQQVEQIPECKDFEANREAVVENAYEKVVLNKK